MTAGRSVRTGESARHPKGWRRVLHILLALALLLAAVAVGFYRPLLEWAASRLVVSDPLQRSDAIIVLAGERGERVRHASRLFQEGWAPLLLMSGGPAEANVPLADLMRDQAEREGVPASAILLQDRSVDTGEDARYSLKIAEARGWRRVILVTSPYHARRAVGLFRAGFSRHGIEILSSPVAHSWFSPHRWWTRKQDTKEVLLEYLKSAWYACFPTSRQDAP